MRTERIVRRQNQREQLQALKDVMKNSRVLIEADKKLRQVFMAGYRKRLEEEIKEHAEHEAKVLDVGETLQSVPVPTEENSDESVVGSHN